MGKLTKKEIVKELQLRTGLSQRLLSQIVDNLLEEIKLVLELGEEVKISGFGTFKPHLSKPRKGRIFKSGEKIVIPSVWKVAFNLSPTFRLELHNEKGKR